MGDTLTLKLQAARVRLKTRREYTASLLLRLKPVKTPGLGTIGVDESMRLYFDPKVDEKYSVPEMETILYHEVLHVWRRHPARALAMVAKLNGAFDKTIWGLAVDAEINDDIQDEKVFAWPQDGVTPERLGVPRGLTAEQYYEMLAKKAEDERKTKESSEDKDDSDSESGGEDEPKDKESGEDEPDSDSGSDDSEPGGEESDEMGEGEDDSDGDGESEDGEGQSGDKEGDGEDSDDGQGKDGEPDGKGKGPGGTPSGPSDEKHGEPGDQDGEGGAETDDKPGSGRDTSKNQESGDGKPDSKPKPMAGDDGSVGDGQRREWEQPKARNEDEGVTDAEKNVLIREMAHEIERCQKARGNVPGHMRRDAGDELAPPKVPWYRVLASVVKQAVAYEQGCSDFTYRKESRRHEPGFILPGTCQPEIHVAVVVDTSGSMGQEDIARMLSEIKGILKSIGQRNGLSVLSCDAEVHTCQRVFSVRQVQAVGGGGTDMGKGIEAALALHPKPEICVVLTDGWTPWPDEAPRGMKVIVGSTDRDGPAWAKTVHIDLED